MNMRTVTVTLSKAKEWYNSGNAELKEIALQAFDEEEINAFDFTQIKTFEDALSCIYKPNSCEYDTTVEIVNRLRLASRASAAMFKLNIIRKVLNKDYDMYLTKDVNQDRIWYPCFRFIMNDLNNYTKEQHFYIDNIKKRYDKLGEITEEEVVYDVLGGNTNDNKYNGLSCFCTCDNTSMLDANVGFLGCATKEIAKHFGKYFGMLIMEAMYSDLVDFHINKNK